MEICIHIYSYAFAYNSNRVIYIYVSFVMFQGLNKCVPEQLCSRTITAKADAIIYTCVNDKDNVILTCFHDTRLLRRIQSVQLFGRSDFFIL